MYLCVCVCVCVCMHMYACRVSSDSNIPEGDNNVLEESLTISTVLEGSQGRHLDNRVYSTIDNTDQLICDPNQEPVEHSDHTYFDLELTQEQEMEISEVQVNGEAPKEAAIAE